MTDMTLTDAIAEVKPEALIDLIGELGRQVYYLLDDCETSGDIGSEVHTITDEGLAKVSAILDQIDALPFQEPGYILGPGAKLEAAIKRTFIPASDALYRIEAQAEARVLAVVRQAHETLIEINPNNYTHDEVVEANDAVVEAIFLLADLIGETHGKSSEWWKQRRAALAEQEKADG